MLCQKCGANVPDNAYACPHCGTVVNAGYQYNANPQPQQQVAPQQFQPMQSYVPQPVEKPKKSKKKLIIILAIVAVLLIAIIAIAAGGSSSDTSTPANTDSSYSDTQEQDTQSNTVASMDGFDTLAGLNDTGACVIDNSRNATTETMQQYYDFPTIETASLMNATAAMGFKDIIVENVQVNKGYYEDSLSFSTAGSDIMTIDVNNNSGQTITNVSLVFICTTDRDTIVSIGEGFNISSFNASQMEQIADKISQFSFAEDVSMDNNTKETMAIRCDLTVFSTACCAVYSYTTEDGEEHVNPEFEDWILACV